MATDQLNVSQYAQMAGLDEGFVRSHPAILKLVRKAIKEGWNNSEQGKANFQREFEQTPWFKQNASWARGYLLAQAQGGADFDAKRETARETVKARAVQMGAVLDDAALDRFTTAYFMGGWGEQGREGMLDRALAGELEGFDTTSLNFSKGGPQAIMTQLKSIARANGVDFSESYFQGAAKMVLAGMQTANDYAAEIRTYAASRMPIFKDRIMAGENARDIASPYIKRMAEVLELDENSIGLNDPWITKALGGVGQDGKPTAMSFWDFEKSLRKDDRWQYTKQAHNEVSNLTREVVRMFGFGG